MTGYELVKMIKDNDEEAVSLVTENAASKHPSTVSKWQRFVAVVLVGCLLLFFWDTAEWDNATAASESRVKNKGPPPPLTNSKHMLERLQQARQQWIETQLKKDYGETYYKDIFEPDGVNVGKQRAFVDPNRLPRPGRKYEDYKDAEGPAWDRMVRKWTIKLLQIQLNMLQQQSATSEDGSNKTTYGKFVWANGGHSASAGHGNFHRESYTAILERDLQPTLQQIGLDFQVRNYAMGGTGSGEEVALCFNSIFGKDIDSITWDYGMTDGGEYHRFILYAYNAARLAAIEDSVSQPGDIRHRPSLLVLHHNDDMEPILQTIQNLGMSVLAMDTRFQKEHMYPGFPDMFGKTDAEIAAIPPFVQYFKCNEQIEAGEPGCADQKFNMTFCQGRDGRNTWHPGWRYHALMGHTMAHTVFELIEEALNNLIALEPEQPETSPEKHARLMAQLQQLDAAEQQDYNYMLQTPIPIELKQSFDDCMWKGDQKDDNKEAMKDLGMAEKMAKDFSFCHTALLPAEIRYRGILTENMNQTGTEMEETYEQGILQGKLMEAENPSEEGKKSFVFMNPVPSRGQQMVIGANDDEYEAWCEEEATVKDHKDFFFISSQEGWRTLSFPNDMEQEYYTEFMLEQSKGWIFVCMSDCFWGNCNDGDVRGSIMDGSLDAGELGRIEMEVNDVSVTDAKCLHKCCALRHTDTDPQLRFQWTPNEEGKFNFRTRITGGTKYAYARFSSFIVV